LSYSAGIMNIDAHVHLLEVDVPKTDKQRALVLLE
jgi:hypothetical protein